MALGELTLFDILLTLIGIFAGGWLLWLFVGRKSHSKNKLKKNQAAGDIAGADIFKGKAPEKGEILKQENVLKDNAAGGDIAGGNIYKDES